MKVKSYKHKITLQARESAVFCLLVVDNVLLAGRWRPAIIESWNLNRCYVKCQREFTHHQPAIPMAMTLVHQHAKDTFIASSDNKGKVCIWSLNQNDHCLAKLDSELFRTQALHVCDSAGMLLVGGCRDSLASNIVPWNFQATSKSLREVLPWTHRCRVVSIHALGSSRIVSSSVDGDICVWNNRCTRVVSHLATCHPLNMVSLSNTAIPLGREHELVCAYDDGGISRLDLNSDGKLVHKVRVLFEFSTPVVETLGANTAACGTGKLIHLIDRRKQGISNTLRGHTEPVICLTARHDDDDMLFSGGLDKTIRLWC